MPKMHLRLGCAPDPAGKLIAFLPRPLAGFGGRFAAGREMRGKERGREWKETEGKKTEGKGRKEGEGKGQEEREKDGRGKDGPLRLRIPGNFLYPSPPLK